MITNERGLNYVGEGTTEEAKKEKAQYFLQEKKKNPNSSPLPGLLSIYREKEREM